MNNKKIHLRIITPHEIKVEQKADMVIARCINGDIGILPNHEATSAVLDDGILRIINEGVEQKMAVFGGIANIKNDTVNILTNYAERAENIDRARAENDRRKLEQLLQEQKDDLKMQSYQVLLRRALVEIELSSQQIFDDQSEDE